MNQPVRRGLKVFSPQGLITLPLVLIAAFCAWDSCMRATDYVRLSWLVVQFLSFPLGWLAHWLATIAFSPGKYAYYSFADSFFIFVISAAGTVLNIHLFVSAIFWYFRNRNLQRPPEEREAEFQKLLAEHRKRSS